MIKDKDRSGWFGASDTSKIMGKWTSRTWQQWWLVKLGLRQDNWSTLAMQTGTAYEHRILEHLGIVKMDRQIRIRRLRLRVNLDGETAQEINEVKTYGTPSFRVSNAYWQQAQVEMYAASKPLKIVAYRLEPDDYTNWFRPIDENRISEHWVDYDDAWIREEYLPRLRYLAGCLKRREWPNEDTYRCCQGSDS